MKITEQQLRQVIKEEIDAQVSADDFKQISKKLSKLYRRLENFENSDQQVEVPQLQAEVMDIRKQLVALRRRVTGE
jgi:uncharacterized protein YpuA (DUF1002 family)